jgi:hypothetical protein
MKVRIATVALATVFCGSLLCVPSIRAAEQPVPSDSKRAHDEAQQLVKDRDAARVKAKAAEQKMRDAGQRVESLGFVSAKATRDRQAASGSKATAFDRYAKATREMEKKIQDEVSRGVQPLLCEDIARFERLQGEVELARLLGRLPAEEK